MPDREVDWPAYLARFHAERPGVVEDVLSRSLRSDHNPYRWLARAVSADAATVVDLASGSGPVARELALPGRTVVGLDLSAAELGLARRRGAGPLVRADARTLPFRDGSVDVVTSALGLVVVQPLAAVLSEVARVLRPGGVLAAIAPAVRPLAASDLRRLGQLNARLRGWPRFPGPVELTGFRRTLAEHGLQAVEDKRERYRYTVATPDDAWLLLSALYLPLTPQSRVAAAVDHLCDVAERRGPVEIAIPVRRLVAIK
ncbi:class I SAM-dependent methyltransferase [Microlunatus flavus]|uniref:Methyltransferase domain-containing protein n=1 Tax=Microlunatus flavus TaxID=1036181 RepID=A0A1H9LNR8_9ACTN|nr:class I SAM-dependent methyltransferase [Microlunatus flavus]SER12533.1 Methyltransferase domain-containing protein [Microlunatus flavus]